MCARGPARKKSYSINWDVHSWKCPILASGPVNWISDPDNKDVHSLESPNCASEPSLGYHLWMSTFRRAQMGRCAVVTPAHNVNSSTTGHRRIQLDSCTVAVYTVVRQPPKTKPSVHRQNDFPKKNSFRNFTAWTVSLIFGLLKKINIDFWALTLNVEKIHLDTT